MPKNKPRKEEFDSDIVEGIPIRDSSELPMIHLDMKCINPDGTTIGEIEIIVRGDTLEECHKKAKFYMRKWKEEKHNSEQ